MKISLIAALAANGVIGHRQRLPWRLGADLQRFRELTWGAPILMGRATHESIGRPLPGRRNLVVSRQANYQSPGCEAFTELDQALEACQQAPEVFVIGGETLYRALLPRASRLYLTHISKAFEGDTFFPDVDWQRWQRIECSPINVDDSGVFSYQFATYQRI
ncbi:MAG: dihydrofolate reductase [Methylococcales bacterium]|nr:dihydrofolate reductase [Methylococcales bacterium]